MAGQRRRGQELEEALLQAAWDELTEAGFSKMTMESVAARAKTGVAVLYRRWPRKDDLAIAAIRHYGQNHPVDIPDKGSLRDDLLALISTASDQRQALISVFTASAAGMFADSGLTPAQVRERAMVPRPYWSSDQIYRRAHDRGEIDLDTIPPAVLAMPFDLMRHDLLMTLQAPTQERVHAIVDDLFLPLVASYRRNDDASGNPADLTT
jgi:AcrR family transcriptional regulator